MKMHNELIEDINRTALAPGGLAFWWLGQMGYVVKAGGLVFYLDPYLAPQSNRQIPPLVAPEEVTHADWVLCSHDHSDHMDPVAIHGITKASPKARFVCSRVARAKLLSLGVPPERVVGLDEGIVLEEPGLRISAIAAQHEFFHKDPELGYPYLMYVIEVGGRTILHAGDTLRYDGLQAKLSRWIYDILFLPINGRDAARFKRRCWGNMTYQEAVDLAGELQPRLVVPGHYDMFANNAQDPHAFADYMDLKYPQVRYWIGDYGEAVILPMGCA